MYRIILNLAQRSISRNSRMFHIIQNSAKKDVVKYSWNSVLALKDSHLQTTKRFKSKRKKKLLQKQEEEEEEEKKEEEEEEEEEDENQIDSAHMSKDTKLIKAKVLSLRLDVIAKVGSSMARSKIEELLYMKKIRLNGYRITKKSVEVNLDDEIDIIHGISLENPNMLEITRLKLIMIQPTSSGIKVEITRDIKMLLENYADPWKAGM